MSGIPGNLQELGARFFGIEEEPLAPTAKVTAKRREAERRWAIAKDYAATFSTPAGRRVLAHLTERLHNRPTFDATLGLLNGTANGFAREGQNSVLQFIRQQIANASKEP